MFPVRRAGALRLSSSNPNSHGGTTGATSSCGTRSAGGRQRAGAYASQVPMGGERMGVWVGALPSLWGSPFRGIGLRARMSKGIFNFWAL